MADGFFTHELNISQPANGYRFSVDSLILAAQIHPKGNEKVMDIGCGCGIISLLLAYRYPDIQITGIEIDEELCHWAKQNVLNNGFENVRIQQCDIQTFQIEEKEAKADIIVSNPPYKKIGTGRLNPNRQKTMARHEISLNIHQLIQCSSHLIKDQGLLCIIFPFDRMNDLTLALGLHDFFLESIRYIHIKPETKAWRVIVRAIKNGAEQTSSPPPLYIYTKEDKYTEEYLSLFRP